MEQQIRRLFETVTEDDEARTLLEENPLSQNVVFRTEGEDDVLAALKPHSADVSVTTASEEYELFETTVVDMNRETLDALLEGAYLSEYYLDGALQIRGLPSIKILLGQLFRINREQRAR